MEINKEACILMESWTNSFFIRNMIENIQDMIKENNIETIKPKNPIPPINWDELLMSCVKKRSH